MSACITFTQQKTHLKSTHFTSYRSQDLVDVVRVETHRLKKMETQHLSDQSCGCPHFRGGSHGSLYPCWVSTKESKDIREPNKVKSIQPLIFHFLMFKVRNAGCEYTDFFNFSRGNFWCIPCLDIQLNSTLQPAITKFFCCLIGSPIYKASLGSATFTGTLVLLVYQYRQLLLSIVQYIHARG